MLPATLRIEKPGNIGPGAGFRNRVTVFFLATCHRQDVLLNLCISAGFKHPFLRFREAPGQCVGYATELFPDSDLFEKRQFKATLVLWHVEQWKTKFDRSRLVAFGDLGRQYSFIELCLHFMRLQIIIGKLPGTGLPFARTVT